MDLLQLDPAQMLSFLLTLLRISLVVFLLPFFGGQGIPNLVKAALTLILTLGFWPHLSFPGAALPAHPLNMALMVLGELILGLVLGLLVHIIFAAVQTAGQVIGFQMGFAMMNVVDPMTGVSEAITAQFLYMITLLLFLSMNGHLYMLKGFSHSFELVPPGGLLITPELVDQVVSFSRQIFVLAVKIAAPVMAAVFLVDLALALIGRAAPQMNVLFVGFPLKIAVGFLFISLIFTLLARFMEQFVGTIVPLYNGVLRAAG